MNRPANRLAIQNRLFRLIVLLKAMTWIAILMVLGVSVYRLATGDPGPMPQAPLYAIGVLVSVQLLAMLAWRLVRQPRSEAGE